MSFCCGYNLLYLMLKYHDDQWDEVLGFIPAAADKEILYRDRASGQSTLHVALEYHAPFEVIRLLILHGADVNASTKISQTPLHYACWSRSSLEVVEHLLDCGARVNAKDEDERTPLHGACYGHTQNEMVIRLLVARGAEVNARSYQKQTPLHEALLEDEVSLDAIRALLELGADVEAEDDEKDRPLHMACYNKIPENVVQELLRAKPDVDARNKDGDTPLHLACSGEAAAGVIRLLLESDANPNLHNDTGKTPADLETRPEVLEILQYTRLKPFFHDLFALTSVTGILKQRGIANRLTIAGLDSESRLSAIESSELDKLGILPGDAKDIARAIKTLHFGAQDTQTRKDAVEASQTIPDALLKLPPLRDPYRFYFFASHNWGSDSANHHRVTALVQCFQRVTGTLVWFDEQRLEGNILAQITKGIDQSAFFVAFITRAYIEKVDGGMTSTSVDWCHEEFNYAYPRRKGRTITIVMEKDIKVATEWTGPVGTLSSVQCCLDFTSDDKLDKVVQDLHAYLNERSLLLGRS